MAVTPNTPTSLNDIGMRAIRGTLPPKAPPPVAGANDQGIYVSGSNRSPSISSNGLGYAGAQYIPGQGQPGAYTVGPDGSVQYDPGAGRNAAPAFTGSAGRYTAFTNRLPIGQAGAGTDPALTAAIQQALARTNERPTNAYIDPAAEAQGQARGMQVGAAGALSAAGGANAGAQGFALGQGVAQGNESRGQEQALAALLGQGALGGGPSAAQAQFQSGLQQNIAAQHALAAGARGQGTAAALRGGTEQGVQLGLQSQVQAAQLRAQEQQAAQQALGNVLANTRGGDINSVYALGNLASTGRAQDIGQAGAVVDAAGNIRQGDIQAGATFGGLGNQLIGLQQQQQQLGLNAGLQGNAQRLQGLGLDINALLQGGQLMANYDQGVRGQNIQTRGQDIGLGENIAGGALGLGSAAFSSPWLMGGRGGGGGGGLLTGGGGPGMGGII